MDHPQPAIVVPPLPDQPPGLPFRALALFLPGVRKVVGQIRPYTHYWSAQNNDAASAGSPLLVAIGDSTAIGVGASDPENGYVGRIRRSLSARDNEPWNVVNLARSGAKADDGLHRQLPIAETLASQGLATLTVCCIGNNDALWNRNSPHLRDELKEIIGRLPRPAVIGLIAGSGTPSRAANRAIRQAATTEGIDVVDPWRLPGSGRLQLAEDGFHPGDEGYRSMAQAFTDPLGSPRPAPDPT